MAERTYLVAHSLAKSMIDFVPFLMPSQLVVEPIIEWPCDIEAATSLKLAPTGPLRLSKLGRHQVLHVLQSHHSKFVEEQHALEHAT